MSKRTAAEEKEAKTTHQIRKLHKVRVSTKIPQQFMKKKAILQADILCFGGGNSHHYSGIVFPVRCEALNVNIRIGQILLSRHTQSTCGAATFQT
jgi:hypothetical protein